MAQKTAHLLHTPMLKNDREMIQHILAASIEEPYIRATHAYYLATNENFHSGPQFIPTDNTATPNINTPTQRATSRSIRFTHPLVDINGENALGWVEIELLSSPYVVLRYEAIILSISLTILC